MVDGFFFWCGRLNIFVTQDWMAQLLLDVTSAAASVTRDRAVYNKIDVRVIFPHLLPSNPRRHVITVFNYIFIIYAIIWHGYRLLKNPRDSWANRSWSTTRLNGKFLLASVVLSLKWRRSTKENTGYYFTTFTDVLCVTTDTKSSTSLTTTIFSSNFFQ